MNLAFGIAMFIFVLFGAISIIGVLWAVYKKRPKKIWIASILVNLTLLIGSSALYNNLLTPEERNVIATQREQHKAEQTLKDTQEKGQQAQEVQQNQNSSPSIISPEETLTSTANKSLGKNFKKIEVNNSVDDPTKKIVLVHYNGADGYNNAMARKAMLIQTADLFQELFATGVSIHEVTAFIYADMKGVNGSHEGLAMKCQLKGNTAANINWANMNKTKFDQSLDYVWISPGLKE